MSMDETSTDLPADFQSDRCRKLSQWSSIVNQIKNCGSHLTEEARHLLNKTSMQALTSEYLFDPHPAYQRTYGSISESPQPSPPDSRRPSESPQYEEVCLQEFDEERPLTSPPIVITSSTLPQFRIETEPFQTNENEAVSRGGLRPIPIINIHPEQDFNYLTVDSATRFHANSGRNSPCRRSSGFLSGSVSPILMTNSFDFPPHHEHVPEKYTWRRNLKILLFAAIFVVLASIIITTSVNNSSYQLVTASSTDPYEQELPISETLRTYYPILTVLLSGGFLPDSLENSTEDRLLVSIHKEDANGNLVMVTSDHELLEIPIFKPGLVPFPDRTISHGFNLQHVDWEHGSKYFLVFRTNTLYSMPFSVSGRFLSQAVEIGAIFGGAVMIGLYVLIIFELINRTLAAMLAAVGAIGGLAVINERPTTEDMVSWLDMETLILLFSMMVIVSMLCETGFFDYASYLMYKVANGQVWPLITSMCFFTAIVSSFLDNVTTILLMTPVTIRICEAMELNPVPVLISIVIFSNIGGAATPIGDPPNVIISNNRAVVEAGIDFTTFCLHMILGIIPVLIVAYFQLRYIFRSIKSLKFAEPYEITELRREIDVWARAADSLSAYSKDESQVKSLFLSKVVHLQNKLKSKIRMGGQSEENFQANLLDLEATCKIRDWSLLIKCAVVLSIMILLFFLHSVPQLNVSIGWTALLGAVFLLILADRREIEGILGRVEWSTLIFFSALFIVMEGVSRLGLLEWIGNQTEGAIKDVNEPSRLTVATILILWVSGIASAFIDNIPFTTMMIQIVTRLSQSLSLPLQPLVWALALGTCLGGNGTLIGASANVVAAGVADQHGYKFTFIEYFRIGFPMMLISLVVSTVYLLICHTLLEWNH